MINVLREQQSVCKAFTRNMKSILAAASDPFSDTRFRQTRASLNDLLEGINERILELQRLADTATETSSALNDLLGLKQQQMGVVEARLEARETVEQGREVLRQGRTIMLFTVVTIVFVPLSFVTGNFGMNVAELNDGNLNIRQELRYMFPVALSFSIITLGIAFKIYTTP
ncbi:hypothetical protein HYALB_00004427 [Hymenoscyphus albidus]|uniref:Uncharacterized protein n=1 Tax=Hymenoscyphus albidus TaxID=595503 RepID=A0A9N9LJE7_9HELO|nr:hypothetical protein HYALB_00004427 [Hymenoscyphus albidus]